MKIAVLSDTHYGCRKGSKYLHDHFELFYKNIFFPALEQHGITTVIHMGDAFDNRRSIDLQSLEWAKQVVFNRIVEMGITMHMIVGNHDTYFKNTNSINSVGLLLKEYENIKIYSEVTEVELDKLKVLFVPWINQENEEKTLKLIQKTSCTCAMGHLS